MSKIYQPKKGNPYRIPDSLYPIILAHIRNYGQYLRGYYQEHPYLIEYAPTAEEIRAIQTALEELPEEYRDIILYNIAYEEALPEGYRNKGTTLLKAQFIKRSAQLLGYQTRPSETIIIERDWRYTYTHTHIIHTEKGQERERDPLSWDLGKELEKLCKLSL